MMSFFRTSASNPVFHEASSPGRSSSVWMWIQGLVIVLLILVIAAFLVAGRALSGAIDGRDAAARAQGHLQTLELSLALEDLAQAQASFEQAERSLRLLSPLGWIPGARRNLLALRSLVHAASVSSRVFGRTLETGVEALTLIGEDEDFFRSSNKKGELLTRWTSLDREKRALILARLKTRLPALEVSRNDLHLALEELEEAFAKEAHPILERQKDALAGTLRLAQGSLETFTQGVALLTSVSDEDGGRVLLLFLNDNELRPGGGFLGSFGILTLDAGAITNLTTYDVMAVDGPVLESWTEAVPEPLSEYLSVPAWFLRDANWSPDFGESAERALALFSGELVAAGTGAAIDPNLKIDAVVGLTTGVVADFLRVLGDVEAGGERFTSDNISDALENAVEFTFANRGVTHDRRKDVIQDIADIMRERFAALTLSQWSEIFTSVAVRLRDKHLLFYAPDADMERLFVRQGWAGRVAENFDGDYLMVVDANLAALKTDPAVSRTIEYRVSLEGDDLVASVAVAYNHTRPFGPKVTRYRTFTRLYAPEGSELLSVEGSLANDALKNPSLTPDVPVVSEELGKTVFGAFVSVEPLTRRTLMFRYRLPRHLREAALRGSYDLLVQKQPGARNHALTLDLEFDTKLKRAVPAEEAGEWGDTRYRLNTILDQDLDFEVDL